MSQNTFDDIINDSGKKPLSELVLTKIYVAKWRN